MILNFTEADFVPQILDGQKLHTIRRDPIRRWKVGTRIDFWFGFPRVLGSGAFKFGTGTVAEIKRVMLCLDCVILGESIGQMNIFKSGQALDSFARHDGFADYAEMRAWLVAQYGKEAFNGRLITWAQPIERLPA